MGNYARKAQEWNLFQSPAAANKMKYILDVLKTISPCTLVSLAAYKDHTWKLCRTKKIVLDEKETNVIMPSVGSPIRLLRAINAPLVPLFVFLYTLFNVKRNDTVIVYHSNVYMKAICLCKRIKKFRLIMEIEEIYSDVSGNMRGRRKEIKLFKDADGYIFPTSLLEGAINFSHKPSVIIHGTYHVEPVMEKCKDEFVKLHDKIHIVYAGTFDPRKGGAAAAAEAAAYLPSNYHIHILGFGNENDKKFLRDIIDRVAKMGKANITMDGLLSGEEYTRFLQSCDVGLSTQNPDAAFNATSFPSKILSYMSNGLRVVSIRIPAVEKSDVGRHLYYYDEQTPENIAKAILSIDFSDGYYSRSIIEELSNRFAEELSYMLG